MSEQAQANGTATVKAPPPKRTRPSRAKGARLNGAHPANGTAAMAGAQTAEHEQTNLGAAQQSQQTTIDQRNDATAQGPTAEEIARQQEALRLEGERREAAAMEAAREASARDAEAQRQAMARVQAVLQAYHGHSQAGATFLANASSALTELFARGVWAPGDLASMEAAIQRTIQNLALFKARATDVAAIAAEAGQYMQAGEPDIAKWYTASLEAMREHRRRLDALISLMESDIGNMPAIAALERSIAEQAILVAVLNRSLGHLLTQNGMVR